jgi:hypothetical protein
MKILAYARVASFFPRSRPGISFLLLFLRIATGFVAAGLLLLFLATALRRLHYPYELDLLEGNMVLCLQRVMRGQSLYPPPTIHFLPYMYAPGYFYLAAWLGKLIGAGAGFFTLRLTSILATLGGFGVIYLLVWKEVRRHLAAFAAVGAYAACYHFSNAWFDTGRVDSLFVFLVLASIFATRHWHPVIAALFWLSAFVTKQSILPFAILLMCFHWEHRWRTLSGLAILGAGAIAIIKTLDSLTDGWFHFYVIDTPKANADLHLQRAFGLLPRDILAPLGPACIVILAAILLTRLNWRSLSVRFYAISSSLIFLCGLIRMHGGSSINSIMPAWALLAVVFGICFARIDTWLESQPLEQWKAGSVLLLSAVLVQLLCGFYPPGQYLPTSDEQAAVAAVIRQAQEQPGDVYINWHTYYGVLAGKSEFADECALHDTLAALNPASRHRLQSEMGAVLSSHSLSGVFFESADSVEWFNKLMNLDAKWENEYPVRMQAPATEPTTAGSWLVLRCPLPANEYGSISAPLSAPVIEGCTAAATPPRGD